MVSFDRSDAFAPDRLDPDGSDPDGFGLFAARLGRHVGIDLSGAEPGSLLRDDLGFDSLAMAEALVLLAGDGIVLPDELIPELRTAGDLHHYVRVLGPRPAPVRPTVGVAP